MKRERARILLNIQNALQRKQLSLAEMQLCHAHLQQHPRCSYANKNRDEHNRLENFISAALSANAVVNNLNKITELPNVILDLINQYQLSSSICISQHELFHLLSWQEFGINIKKKIEEDNMLSITGCFCAVAETGTLVMLSNEHPTTYNFLAAVQVVVLSKKQIVNVYEDVWDKIRIKKLSPRTVHFVTGPSRTADIEQTLQLGMHGPRQLHILIDDENDVMPAQAGI